MLNAEVIAEKIIAALRGSNRSTGITWIEIEREAAVLGVNTQGELWIMSPTYENVAFWPTVSQDFIDVYQALAPSLDIHEASPISYMADGKVPSLPLVKQPPCEGYRKPHWLPLRFEIKEEVSSDA